SVGVLNTAVTAQVDINVQCTKTTVYNVALDPGAHGPGGVTDRHLSAGGADSIADFLYRGAGRTLNWGQTLGTHTVSGAGNGSDIASTVYGRIPVQSSVTPGAYTDAVTITVSF